MQVLFGWNDLSTALFYFDDDDIDHDVDVDDNDTSLLIVPLRVTLCASSTVDFINKSNDI